MKAYRLLAWVGIALCGGIFFLSNERIGERDREIFELKAQLAEGAKPTPTPAPKKPKKKKATQPVVAMATPVPTPIPTPVPTPIPTPVPTPIPTPVPTPSPTPVPEKKDANWQNPNKKRKSIIEVDLGYGPTGPYMDNGGAAERKGLVGGWSGCVFFNDQYCLGGGIQTNNTVLLKIGGEF
jgi:hypothetical protein